MTQSRGVDATGGRMILDDIGQALAENGLALRGGVVPAGEDGPLEARDGRPASSVLLVGQRGAEPWPHFTRWLRDQASGVANPLDTWSRQVIGAVAKRFGARAVSPSDRPYLPFQQWAMRAEGLRPSPLGILMHPEYGLWHAYRGALIFGDGPVTEAIAAMPAARAAAHPCESCTAKPCLTRCPVGAHSEGAFDYRSCLAHAGGQDGAPCRSEGCFDRNACPVGQEWRYPREVQQFHMRAFLGRA